MEKQIASKLGKEYVNAVFCDTAYLIYMQSKSLEMLHIRNEAQAGIKTARKNQ